jgi:hypothetical protein
MSMLLNSGKNFNDFG